VRDAMIDLELVRGTGDNIRREIAKAVVGQDEAVVHLLAGLLTGGHVLLEGVPGTAKTLMVKALALTVGCEFKRVQMTPDLMPSDIVGTAIYDRAAERFVLRKGPVFTNLLLADEINRAPAKTQAALLEAMEEGMVTIDGEDHMLSPPFMVCATQNPIEHEGTYVLPEAQLDRFMFKVLIDYPPREIEGEMLQRHHQGFDPKALDRLGMTCQADCELVARCRAVVQQVEVHDAVADYILDIVRATRDSPLLTLGASPRATALLLMASKVRAALWGRAYVTPDDVKAMAPPTLRHRLLIQPEAELDGIVPDDAVQSVIDAIPVPR